MYQLQSRRHDRLQSEFLLKLLLTPRKPLEYGHLFTEREWNWRRYWGVMTFFQHLPLQFDRMFVPIGGLSLECSDSIPTQDSRPRSIVGSILMLKLPIIRRKPLPIPSFPFRHLVLSMTFPVTVRRIRGVRALALVSEF